RAQPRTDSDPAGTVTSTRRRSARVAFNSLVRMLSQRITSSSAIATGVRAPNATSAATSRSYTSIVIANVFTVFNAILIGFGIVTFAFGDPEDALFVGIVVVNATIGIGQEIRAKRALDRLAAIVAPTASVIRDGRRVRLPVSDIVVGDTIQLDLGDQV